MVRYRIVRNNLVNNAAQTIRRPELAYRALLAGEREELPAIACRWLMPPVEAGPGLVPMSLFSQEDEGPVGPVVPADGLAVDEGGRNSWGLRLGEVGLAELVEAQLVNGMAPFVLMQGLLPLLTRSPHPMRFVVNVAAREGQLSVGHDGRHPHTDMAKASLNMLTRSCAEELALRGVYVNSVDPGWVSHQGTAPQIEALEAAGVLPPLDAEDGAARVCAPVFDALNTGRPMWGKLFKDFREAAW
jgi:NAD(P)-dependent dehydrogenase (short-subunit alcohol dehydrogenase family)